MRFKKTKTDEVYTIKVIKEFSILGIKFKIKKIKTKKTSLQKLDRYDFLNMLHSIILLIACIFYQPYSTIIGILFGLIISFVIYLHFINEPFYLDDCLTYSKHIKRTEQDCIIFNENVEKENKLGKTITIIYTIFAVLFLIGVALYFIAKFINIFGAKIDLSKIEGGTFIIGFSWGLYFLLGLRDYLKTDKLRKLYNKEFFVETKYEYNDYWVGKE